MHWRASVMSLLHSSPHATACGSSSGSSRRAVCLSQTRCCCRTCRYTVGHCACLLDWYLWVVACGLQCVTVSSCVNSAVHQGDSPPSSLRADSGHMHCILQAQKEKRDDLMAEIELLKQQHAAIVSSSLSVSAAGSRGSSPLHTTAASPGRLKSPLKNSSSKAGSVKLLVASAHR